jgi:aspartyl-tRNA(Asn)/glutamyl-tRNA(Gln) amidotransferase subunit C
MRTRNEDMMLRLVALCRIFKYPHFITPSMKVDRALIEHVAEVARLKLTDEEIEKFLPQMKEILAAFSELDSVDVEGIKPSFQPVELEGAMREDATHECLSQKESLSNSKSVKDGYFKGPSAGGA